MASNLYELTKGIPKLMLTATPMQNSLFDLFGLMKKKFVIVTISTKKQNVNGVIRWKQHREFD